MGCAGSKQVEVQEDSSTVSTPGGSAVPKLSPPPEGSKGGTGERAGMESVSFTRAHTDITIAEGGAQATMTGYDGGVAASKEALTSGKHFVEFTVLKGEFLYLGVMEAGWGVENGKDVEQEEGGCFYSTNGGHHYPSGEDWEGSQPATEEGVRIGMLLNLDDRCMTVYKNDELLGVMKATLPVAANYCWAASFHTKGDSVRIERKPIPQ